MARVHGIKVHTGAEELHDGVNILRLNTVDNVIANSGHKMTGFQDLHIWLDLLSTILLVYDVHDGCPTLLRNSSTKASNLSGMSQALTLN